MWTLPEDGATSPFMQRSRVDFPAPLAPSSVTNSPFSTSRSMPDKAGTVPEGATNSRQRARMAIALVMTLLGQVDIQDVHGLAETVPV